MHQRSLTDSPWTRYWYPRWPRRHFWLWIALLVCISIAFVPWLAQGTSTTTSCTTSGGHAVCTTLHAGQPEFLILGILAIVVIDVLVIRKLHRLRLRGSRRKQYG